MRLWQLACICVSLAFITVGSDARETRTRAGDTIRIEDSPEARLKTRLDLAKRRYQRGLSYCEKTSSRSRQFCVREVEVERRHAESKAKKAYEKELAAQARAPETNVTTNE